MFTNEYLRLKDRFPKLWGVMMIQVLLMVGLSISNLFISIIHLVDLFQWLASGIVLTSFLVSCYLSKVGENRARLYVIGWLLLVLSIIWHVLVVNGVFEYNPLNRNILYFGIVAQVLVFSIALADRMNQLKRMQQELNEVLSTTNDKLKKSNDALDSFNYHVSHDIKSVLVDGNSLAIMIQKYALQGNTAKVLEIASKLQMVAKNGLSTVKSFLSVGVSETMYDKSEIEEFNIESELKRIQSLHGLNNQVKIEIVNNELIEFIFNKKAFESIMLNFLTNTVKYNDRSPVAKVQFLRKFNDQIIIYEDNGIGLDLQKDRENLFKPFKRIQNHKTTEGTGIGLYLVNQIVLNHGGEIKVESEIGKGIHFEINIPIGNKL